MILLAADLGFFTRCLEDARRCAAPCGQPCPGAPDTGEAFLRELAACAPDLFTPGRPGGVVWEYLLAGLAAEGC